MILAKKIEALVYLGQYLSSPPHDELTSIMLKAEQENPWFTQNNIQSSLDHIAHYYLSEAHLLSFIKYYQLNSEPKTHKIGLILAGNIPCVGFHDILCTFLSNKISIIKCSDKDKRLIPFLIRLLTEKYPEASSYFSFVEKLSNYDAVIATGSNQSAAQFKKYFTPIPHIIRHNRNSIAILHGRETEQQLKAMGNDIFMYFGLGCRSISNIFVPKDYDISRLIQIIDNHTDVINHNKYKNNYDYNLALFLLNGVSFFQGGQCLFKRDENIGSRIATIHYDYYSSVDRLSDLLSDKSDDIQCIYSIEKMGNLITIPLGEGQKPLLSDYADNLDTIQFLLTL